MNDQPESRQPQVQVVDPTPVVRIALLLAALAVPAFIIYGIAALPSHPYGLILVGVFVELIFACLFFAPMMVIEDDER